MDIFIDENMPPQLADSLDILQQVLNAKNGTNIRVLSIKKEFGQGAKDEDWIPVVGHNSGVVITQDYRIQTTRHQRDLLHKHKVGIFFISSSSKTGLSFWDMTELLIKRWPEILHKIRKSKAPFAFRCTQRKKFEKLES